MRLKNLTPSTVRATTTAAVRFRAPRPAPRARALRPAPTLRRRSRNLAPLALGHLQSPSSYGRDGDASALRKIPEVR